MDNGRKTADYSVSSVGGGSSRLPSYHSSYEQSTPQSSYTRSSSTSDATLQAPARPVVPKDPFASTNAATISQEHEHPTHQQFPQELPARTKPPPASARPAFFRFCWHVRWGAYSLRNVKADSHSGSVARTRWRRIAMMLIVFMRIAISAEAIFTGFFWPHAWAAALYIPFSCIGLWSVLACLAHIGDAEGVRRGFGMKIGRKWLDGFLYTMLALHTCIAGVWVMMAFYASVISAVLWLLLWIAIFVVAWTAARPPDYPLGFA